MPPYGSGIPLAGKRGSPQRNPRVGLLFRVFHRRFRTGPLCFPCAYGAVWQRAENTAFFLHRRAGRGTGLPPSHELQACFVGGRDFHLTPVWRIAPAGRTGFRDSAPEREDKTTPTRPFSLGLDPVSFPGKRNGVERKSFSLQCRPRKIVRKDAAVLSDVKNSLNQF